MISQETIEEIKERVRLLEVVADAVDLRQRGSHFVGLCPFHAEKTPSFHLREGDTYYHCFGCGASGNVITFVMETQGLSFPEAIEYLAERFNITVKEEGPGRREDDGLRKRKVFQINHKAWLFFRESLRTAGGAAAAYVAERGISAEAQQAFGIGLSPPRWAGLVEHLRSQKFDEESMVAAGLARRSAKGELYDSFRGRLIFPVWLDSRRIAGFGGRLIPALCDAENRDSSPKYINSQETAVYQKNKILFGVPQALAGIKEHRSLLLVEGYMDVVGLWQVGVRNAVATCGTAVTEQHVQRLSSLSRKVYVLFDGDAAGRTAAGRSFTVFLNSGIDAAELFLPEGEDPDSVARRAGAGAKSFLEGLKQQAVPLLDCHIQMLLKPHGVSRAAELGAAAKARLAEALAKTLSRVASEIERTELIKQAAFRLIVDEEQLRQLVEGESQGERAAVRGVAVEEDLDEDPAPLLRKEVASLPRRDQTLLHAVMTCKEKLTTEVLRSSELCSALDPSTLRFIQGLHEIVFNEELSDIQKKERIKALLQGCGNSWLAHWKKSYQMLEDPSVNMERLYGECLKSLAREQLLRTRSALQTQIRECRDEAEREGLLRSLVELSRRLAVP